MADQTPEEVAVSNFRFKWVLRHDSTLRIFRIGRWMWERGAVGDGFGYSAKLSLALDSALLRSVARSHDGDFAWLITVCGVRIHYRRSYGGRFV